MRAHLTALALLLSAGAIYAGTQWSDPYQWKPDGLFYQAQVLRLEGMSKNEALRTVFSGPLAAERVETERRDVPRPLWKVASAEWIDYSTRFYERRLLVPALAAVTNRWFGVDAMRSISVIGYVLVGPSLYVLLALRFRPTLAFTIAAGAMALQPVRWWSLLPQVDSVGLTLECLALAACITALRRSVLWLGPLVVAVLALSFTRDATVAVLAGAIWIVWRRRDARSVTVAAVVAVSSAPAPLAFGAPLRDQLAYSMNGFYIPVDQGWSWIFHRWPGAVKDLVLADLRLFVERPGTVLFLAGGLFALVAFRWGGSDEFVAFVRASTLGALAMLAIVPNVTNFRLELVLVPMAAVGLGLFAESLAPSASERVRRLSKPRASIRPRERS